MAGLFSVPNFPATPTPPPAPTVSATEVQAADRAAQQQAAASKGRASTVLTDPQSQRSPSANQQQYLGGVL